MTGSMTDASNQQNTPLPDGTVLAGRYRIVRHAFTDGTSELYEGQDLALGERAVVLVRVDAALIDDARAAWMALPPPVAPLLDVVATDGGAVCVAPLPAGARPLGSASNASREQRAANLVDLVDAIHASPDEPALRWTQPGCAWVVGTDTALRSWFVPLPVSDVTGATARGDDLYEVARLTLADLYGIRAEESEDEVRRLPDPLADLVLPWLSNDGTAPPLIPSSFARALGVGASAARVPVPTAPSSDTQGAKSRLAAARRRIRTLAVREGIGFLLLLVALGIGFATLLGTEDVPYVSDGMVDLEPVDIVTQPTAALPELRDTTLPPESLASTTESGVHCRSALAHGPVPTLRGCSTPGVDPFEFARADGLSRNQPYVVAFHDDDRLTRLDHYDAGRQFAGYTMFRYRDGALVERTRYDSHGNRSETWTFDLEHNEVEARYVDGSPVEVPCARIAYELDGDGRYISWTCIDTHGAPAWFHDAYAGVRFTYGDDEVQTTFMDDGGEPIARPDGVSSLLTGYDEYGREVLRQAWGPDEQPAPEPETGAPVLRIVYTPTSIQERAVGLDGEPATASEGWSQRVTYFDARGFLREVSYLGIGPEPFALPRSQINHTSFETDARGHVTRLAHFRRPGQPTGDLNGVAVVQYVRDQHGNILQECHSMVGGPMSSALLSGAHCMQLARDARGFTTSVRYFDESLGLTRSEDLGVHEIQFERDVAGRVVAQWYFDETGARATSTDGTRGIEIFYDAWGQPSRYVNMHTPGEPPVESYWGVATSTVAHDASLREVERCYFDAEDRPTTMRNVPTEGASCLRRAYRNGQLHRLSFVDTKGDPVVIALGGRPALRAAVLEFVRDGDGQLLEQKRFGVDGESSLGPPLDCTQPATCLDATGWEWYVP